MRASGGHGRSAGTGTGTGADADSVRRSAAHAAGLLASGASYALCALADAGPEVLGRPTPCAEWDLRALLRHLDDSVAALTEALVCGVVGPAGVRRAGDPLASVRSGIARLADLRGDAGAVRVGDRLLGRADVAVAGAMELTVHGWDVGRATGARRPVPAGLALGLLRHAPRLVPADARGTLFARPVPVPDAVRPGDLLVAYLGRDPAA
ncbi:maleylpyruvate isomerase family mycothiol-dependent enzyme [Actinomadura logoneensis]|uniref:Maleylpyruvate isomerase family mycothiol-dependent enzyme n=1 Tax=Actinomadura logoneensis TaxID=2293572 RepID=A0A372JEG1_9ACTN|nr:maleylpyruvate isomerase family mycothiol-dependent enzyme [Actinomadura logoneensis]RFU38224.1 maleylpyruvate isomerase family mycothiol-dependent enzyme [Actinomadura logoneensis]